MQNISNIRLLFGKKNKSNNKTRNRKTKSCSYISQVNPITDQEILNPKVKTSKQQYKSKVQVRNLKSLPIMSKNPTIGPSIPDINKKSAAPQVENFSDDVIICENNFESEAAHNLDKSLNVSKSNNNTSPNFATDTTPEEVDSSNNKTEINVLSGDVKSIEKTVDKEQENIVIPVATSAPETTSTPNVPPKVDGQTIEIRLTKETRQKDKQTVCRPTSTNIAISHEQAITPVIKRFPGNMLIPQQNVQPAAVQYNQTQGCMNPMQINQQYFNAPQHSQFMAPQPMPPNQFQMQQGFAPTASHVNQTVSFAPTVDQTNLSGLPRYSYPKGIPKSFYRGQKEEFLGNSMTLNFNPPQDTPHLFAPVPPVPQHSFVYSENVPAMESHVYTENLDTVVPQQYSPSQIFANSSPVEEDIRERSETTELSEPSLKRLSAFERLGPVTKPKKPKLTINLMVNKENSIREVVDESKEKETAEKYTPVYLREDILTSTDPTVLKHIKSWPWKKNVHSNKSVTARSSKTVMLLEREQMSEYYEGKHFNQLTVRGYPSVWTKEDVLDAVLDSVRGCPMIPCFIEFSEDECKFLVYECRLALLAIHKYGFTICRDDVKLSITISNPDLDGLNIDFVPAVVLKQRLSMCYDGETKLDLTGFTMKSDVSNFLYFPLKRESNQTELIKIQNVVIWGFLVNLDLSHNRITTINGLYLPQTTPKLKHLNLSHNLIEKMTVLLCSKELSLKSIRLEGNPMCTDYTDPQRYVRVIKMIFPGLTEIDGVSVANGNLPASRNNYCPDEAKSIVEKFLEVYFPLWDAAYDQRGLIKNLYDRTATLTNNFTTRLRYGKVYRLFPTLFHRTHMVYETECESETIEGNKSIAKHVKKWPELEHDPFTFTVDVLHHDENATMVRISGILKLTTTSLADEEHLLEFTRTVILRSGDGSEYKINREWVLWDEPREERAKTAFQITTVKTKRISLELKSTPNNELKEKLTEIFMQITTLERKPSQRCLEIKKWHLKHAIEHFSKLLKMGDISCILKD